jgi:hypothetical protein
MKKFLFMGALAAMLLGTASCSNDMEPAMGDNTVQFTIELPGAIDSRAIADGTMAKQLTVAVYDKEGNHLELDKNVTMNNKRATVTFQLVKGQEYSFAFWAQAPDATCYTFNTTDATMTVNNYTSNCNDEKRDAFYAYRADLTVTGPMTETIYLHRPFAQLNFGASDVAAAKAAGVVAAKSYVEVKQVSTKFDLKSGHASKTDLVDAKFALAALPSDPAKLTVEETQYDWMAMNYFLVPGDNENDKSNIETTLKLYTAADEANAVREITVSNVPVEKNHRTNILGNLFTEDVNFNIIIDERFDQPDYNEYLWDGVTSELPAYDEETQTWTIAKPTQLAGFAKQVSEGKTFAGENVVLDADINLNDKTWTPIGWVTTYQNSKAFKGNFDGQGHTIKDFKIAVRNYGSGLFFRVDGGATIKNLNVDNAFVTGRIGGNVVGIVAGYAYQTVTFENIKVTNSLVSGYGKVGGILGMAADPTGGNTTFKNCTVEDVQFQGVYNIGGLAGLIQGAYNNDIETANTVNCQTWRLYGTNYINLSGKNITVSSKDNTSSKALEGLYWKYVDGSVTQLFSALGKYFTYFDNAFGAQNVTIDETEYLFGSTAGFNFGVLEGYEIMQ